MKKSLEINLPDIGKVEILLTEEQFEKAVADGKSKYVSVEKAKDSIVKENLSFYDRMKDIDGSRTTEDVKDGFVNNEKRWDELFPDISYEDISNTVEEARKIEETKRRNARIACSLIEIAFATYMGKAAPTAMDKIKEKVSE